MYDETFIKELASGAPTPGGGGAAAYAGALASSLASMVANLTIGKKKYAQVESEIKASLARLETIGVRLFALIDEDACAFEPMARAYRMPKNTPEEASVKNKALQASLIQASEVPLSIMGECLEVLHECEFLAENGSRLALSDVGASAVLARAAMHAASLNVVINAGQMDDAHIAQEFIARKNKLLSAGDTLGVKVYDYILSELE